MANHVGLVLRSLWYENLTHYKHSINSEWEKLYKAEVRLREVFHIES